ncbi:MAG: FAD-binding oxidoreductase [Bacteroidaceae bacterium]|nr:FAD-binding oxidoreductase [Bacteroidaceae bacterium]
MNDVRQFIPQERIYTDELRRLAWGTDAGFYRHIPQIVIRSASEDEVSKLLVLSDKYDIPVTFRAAGTALSGQSITDSVLIVAGKNWEKYTIADNGKKITMQPGLVGHRVNQLLAPFGQKLGPDPASIKSAMIGGIVMNNASGMNCGTHANSDKMMQSARIVLADGTVLDTGDAKSREAFKASHPDFVKGIEALRDEVKSNKALHDRIQKKYTIKNVTGLNIRPFIAYEDPFEIIAHLMVGSEGTLAFMSEITMNTVPEETAKSTAMLYFPTMKESCRAVVAMKKLVDQDGPIVKSAEMLDYKSLASVDDPVYLKYVEEQRQKFGANADITGLTAVLTEVKCLSQEQMEAQKQMVLDCLKQFEDYIPFTFTENVAEYSKFWAIRSGIFPSVGGMREPGTTCLIEDVAFPIEDLPEATVELQQLLARHGYDDACIYGHALEGNYHFIINQSFKTPADTERYEKLMDDVIALVVDKYDGSLKAEHGTGRNMAPFVEHEWGTEAHQLMKKVKALFDPKNLINTGVIFNDDPTCHIKNIKPLPLLKVTDLDPDKELAESIYAKLNKCIECGFCEVNCVTCGFTMSSRQRMVIRREISRLQQTGEDPARLELLKKQYQYPGNETCAGDGLCSTSCPMGINIADLTHLIRQESLQPGSFGYNVGNFAANHFEGIKSSLRPVLSLANLGHTILGTTAMNAIGGAMHAAGLPKWCASMPKALYGVPASAVKAERKVVYFPSCINQTMGTAKDSPVKEPLVNKMTALLNKAGYEVIYPKNMQKLCCGTIWESKGMMDIADRKVKELEAALWEASEQGKYPVLCDQSPCLHRMRHCIKQMKLYEPAEFISTFLVPFLKFNPIDRPVAVHVTCSMRLMGLADTIIGLAKKCSTKVVVPEEVGCCGFAGDRGFTHPEVNKYALRKLKPQLEANNIQIGYSNSRTCEIGLHTNTGVPYVSIAYLVDECTTPIE